MRVRYDGPGHVLRAFGKTVNRGKEEQFDEAEVRSLLAQPHIQITPDPAAVLDLAGIAARPSAHGSRRQWAAYAEKRGIAVPARMTRDQIIAAVAAPPDPDPTNPDKEG